MKKLCLPVFLLAFCVFALAACGGSATSGGASNGNGVSFVQFPPASLPAGGGASMSATVTNDPTHAGVNWTVTCSTTDCGMINPTQTPDGLTAQYLAPLEVVPAGSMVTITATAAADATKSVSAVVNITPLGISVVISQAPPPSLAIGASAPVIATVNNDPPTGGGVDWTVTCASSSCGSFNPTHTASLSPTVYTAPAAIPTGGIVTVIATSTADPTQSAVATVTITPPVIAVTLTPAPPATLLTSASATVGATVVNDPANAGVDWTVTCSGASCGSFNPVHTGSGGTTNYTAPATVPAGGTVTITAASTADPTKTATATVSITAISIVFTQAPPASLLTDGTAPISATVTNDTGNKGVDWTATCGSASCGSFNPTHTASGATTTYTAPASAPASGMVTIVATSTADPSQTVSAIVTITPVSIAFTQAPPATLLAGTTTGISATVTNDTANKGVDWTVTCGSVSCGSFNPAHTASGNPTIYTAPAAPPVGGTVTITATATIDPAKTVSAAVTITTPAITITLTQAPPATLVTGGSAPVIATVTNDAANKGVDWTVTCGSPSCGSFSPAHTASGAATTYTAPATVPAGNTVMITATATADPTKTTSATVTITTISIAFTLAPPSVINVGDTATVGAAVANDAANAGVDWTVTCGSASCGSFNPTHTASGTTTVYTAPAVIPAGGTVTVTAASTTDPTKTVSATVTIGSNTLAISFTVPPPATLLSGTSALIGATVVNDAANKGVDWSVMCGSASCGSFNPAHTASGATTTYTAPSSVPVGGTVTITAASTADPSKSVVATVTITAISVSFLQAPPATLSAGAAATISATVANDSANKGLDWMVTCASANCGSFNPAHTASGMSTIYTAPASVPTGGTVTITATSTADPTKSVAATVTITAISVTFVQAPPATLLAGTQAIISATVANDSLNKGVDWTVSCGSANCGSFNPTHTASGGVTIYTAPPAIPTGGTVTITAVSTADPTKTASSTVTITTISIAFTQAPPVILQAGTTATISATAANDPGKGVDWTVTCGSAGACGSFNPAHTASGASTIYSAPANVPTGGTVTITATSTADPTKSVSATVMITPPAITIVFTQAPPSTLQTSATATVSATVGNDPANKGVDWSVTCGSASCGSFNPAHTASGGATVYTAPPMVPTGGTVIITASSTADPTKTVSATVTITAAPITISFVQAPPTTLQTSATAPASATVANDPANAGVDWTATCGSASCGSFNPAHTASGGVTIYTAPATVPTGGTVTITGSSTADPTKTVTATVTITTAAPPTLMKGQYAFSFKGTDGSGPYAVAGSITTDGNGNITSGEQDFTDTITSVNPTGDPLTGNYTIGSDGRGTMIAPDASGRGTAAFAGSTAGFGEPPTFVYYVVNSGALRFLQTDANGLTSGSAFAQGPGPFSNASLSGNFAFTSAGSSNIGAIGSEGSRVAGGVFTADGNGNLTSATVDLNDKTSGAVSNASAGGNYLIASNARGTLTLTGNTGGLSQFAIYVTASQGVLLLELDPNALSTGTAFAQSAGISAGTLKGNYALNFSAMNAAGEEDLSGQAVADGASAIAGTADINLFQTQAPNTPLTGTFTANANGRFPGSLSSTPTGPLQEVFYVVNGSTTLFIETDAAQQAAGILQAQQFAISFSQAPPASLATSSTATLSAVVTNDPTNAGVDWSVTCGSAGACGSFNPTHTASGATTIYTAPLSVPAGNTVTITASSTATPANNVSASVVITSATAISVAFTQVPPASLNAGTSATISATVINDPANAGVNWTVTCGSVRACGSFNPVHTSSGATTQYTAPIVIPTGNTVTITAASVADPTKTANASVTITAAPITLVFTQPPPPMLPTASQATISATVMNDPANAGVDWSVTCLTAGGCGSFNPVHTASGATTAYTAPVNVPSGATVTITATSTTDHTKFVSATVTIIAISVALTQPPPPTLQVNTAASIIATVTNDVLNKGVDWTATCNGANCGSFTSTHTASGAPTTYTAPATVPTGGIVTIIARSTTDPTKAASAVVTITSSIITISFAQSPPAILQTGGTAMVSATVMNDAANKGVDWTVTCGSSACGSFNPTHTASGVTTIYTAPATVPAGGTVNIIATSTADPTKSVTASVTITSNPPPKLMPGPYAFSFKGTDSNGFYAVVGSIITDGAGNITSGEQDFADTLLLLGPDTLTGTYTIGADGRGNMILNVNDSAVGVSGVETLSFALTSTQHGLIIEFDGSATSSGNLDFQTAANFNKKAINGGYAFSVSGLDLQGGVVAAVGGVMTADGAGHFTGGAEDIADGPGITTDKTFTGSFTTPDATFGRGTATIGAAFGAPSTFAYYIVNSGEIRLLETDLGLTTGSIFAQGTGGFSDASLSGNYAFTVNGSSDIGSVTSLGTLVAGGLFTANGSGSITSATVDVNNNGTVTSDASATGTYTIGSNGRGTLTLTGNIGGVSQFAVYPTASQGVLLLELDPNLITTGAALAQASGIGAATFTGNYALNFQSIVSHSEEDVAGRATADGVSGITGIVDLNFFNAITGGLTPNVALTGAFTANSSGRFVGTLDTASTGMLQEVFYVVNSSTVLLIEVDGSPSIGLLQLQQF